MFAGMIQGCDGVAEAAPRSAFPKRGISAVKPLYLVIMQFLVGRRGIWKRLTATVVEKRPRTNWFDNVNIRFKHSLVVAQKIVLLGLVFQ